MATGENVHDLRTAIRRYEAAERLLPGKIRRSSTHREFAEMCKSVFRSTTRIRDLDVVLRRVRQESSPHALTLAEGLSEGRPVLVRSSRNAARSLLAASLPSIHHSDLSERRCRRRARRVEERIKVLASKELQETLSDERDQTSLHRLRKTCKELRYTLEVTTPGAEEAASIHKLEELQEALGAIHDLDIAGAFLSHKRAGPGIADLIRADSRKRHDLYAAFCAAAIRGGRLALTF